MDAHYWNGFAHEYDDWVTDAFTYGRSKTIEHMVTQYAGPDRDVADFGCGPGKMLPFLAHRFRTVYGYDFSAALLDVARKRCEGLANVHIHRADLTQSVTHLPVVDLIVSLNAVLTPDPDLRLNFLVGMASRLDSSGHLLLNVPSVESLLFTYFRQIEWSRSRGQSPREAEMSIDTREISTPAMVAQGIFIRGAQPTKHYLRDELIVLARRDMGLSVLDVMKMEYDWRTEMEDDSVPDWMGDPYPWDWLLLARKP